MQPAIDQDMSYRRSGGIPSRMRLRGLATLAFGLCFCGAAYTAVAHPAFVVRHLPASAPLFALAGSPVNLLGLDFRNVRSSLFEDGPNRVLMVEGLIANIDARGRTVPDLRLAVLADGDKRIYTWVLASPKARLRAGESTEFRARLVAPPAEGTRVDVSFLTGNAKESGTTP